MPISRTGSSPSNRSRSRTPVSPGLDEAGTASAEATLRGLFPTQSVTIELDRLLANLDAEQVRVRSVEVAVKPPKLLISESDALLVLIDGEPLLEPVEQTELMVMINTPSDLFWHKQQGAYYLRVGRARLTRQRSACTDRRRASYDSVQELSPEPQAGLQSERWWTAARASLRPFTSSAETGYSTKTKSEHASSSVKCTA
jgi:hypothetical protein